MSRNKENLRDITTFLMMNNTSPTKGYTAREIADAVPTLREPSVYRILRENPQFVQTENSIHPKRYYFDPLKARVVTDAKSKLHIRPELEVTDRNKVDVIQSLLNVLKSEDGKDSNLRKEVVRVALAVDNALNFQQNKSPLEPAKWETAKHSIDNLEVFAATLYQRIQSIKSDERYGTPEWWAMFTKES